VAQQVESSVIFALTAALYGQIDIQEGVVQQNNFTNYPLVSMAQSPVVETWIVPSNHAPEGVGEPAVPPLAPAVANAMYKLTGKRLRSLPLVS
jgi:isoquinoline 1-oxidoreductase beta subunit